MEKELSPRERFVKERNEKIEKMYSDLVNAGTGRTTAYRVISESIIPPLHPQRVYNILKELGIVQEIDKASKSKKEKLVVN